MTYDVRFVHDQALPRDHDFVLLARGPDSVHVFIRESALTPAVLEDAWAAYRELAETVRS